MKKILLIGILLFSFAFKEPQAFDLKDCLKEINFKDLNSKNVLAYIKENDLIGKIEKICSEEVCGKISMITLEQDIKDFIKLHLNQLKQKDNDYALEAELKGFKIDKMIINSCE